MILLNNRLRGILLLLIVLLLNVSLSLGQSRRVPAKKAKPMLTLTHPISGIKVVFHDPVFINDALDESAWKRISIYLPGEAQPKTMQAQTASGYMLNGNSERRWSPDGRYMSVWDTYNITGKNEFTGQRIIFVSLKHGAEAGFFTKEGYAVSTDSFRGWVKGKPHVMLCSADALGPEEVLEEAQNIW